MVNPSKPSKAGVPPRLSAEARRFFRAISDQYRIEDEGGRRLLQTACECMDMMRKAEAELDRAGLFTRDRYGTAKTHPAVAIVRDSRAGMLASLKALNLDVEPLKSIVGRPPGR